MGAKSDPRPTAIVTTVDTLTSRIATLESQLHASTVELNVARQLYHLIGHEVRTPLTVVLGVLSTLESADLPERERRRLQARALAHAQRLRNVVDDLLAGDAPARSTVPRATLETVALAPLLHAACSAVPRRRLTFDVADGMRVATEPIRLRTIVASLVDDAAAHTLGRVDVGARRAGGETTITVADRGPAPRR